MNRKGQVEAILFGVITLVAFVVGMVIVDDITAETNNTSTATDETHTFPGNGNTITVSNIPLSRVIQITNTTTTVLPTANYTVISTALGTIRIDAYDNATHGNTLDVDYEYQGSTYFSSDLARTVTRFIVPIALLGGLLLAAGLAFVLRR